MNNRDVTIYRIIKSGWKIGLKALLFLLFVTFLSVCGDLRNFQDKSANRGENDCAYCHYNIMPHEPQPSHCGKDLCQTDCRPNYSHCGDDCPDCPCDCKKEDDLHKTHLVEGNLTTRLQCQDCHLTPKRWDDIGHLDSPAPAEVVFSSKASRGGLNPTYTNKTCNNIYCHGASIKGGGNGSQMKWQDSKSLQCSSCHGNPPSGHLEKVNNCQACHRLSFQNNDLDKKRHINGRVEMVPFDFETDTPNCGTCHSLPPNNQHTPATKDCSQCHPKYPLYDLAKRINPASGPPT